MTHQFPADNFLITQKSSEVMIAIRGFDWFIDFCWQSQDRVDGSFYWSTLWISCYVMDRVQRPLWQTILWENHCGQWRVMFCFFDSKFSNTPTYLRFGLVPSKTCYNLYLIWSCHIMLLFTLQCSSVSKCQLILSCHILLLFLILLIVFTDNEFGESTNIRTYNLSLINVNLSSSASTQLIPYNRIE